MLPLPDNSSTNLKAQAETLQGPVVRIRRSFIARVACGVVCCILVPGAANAVEISAINFDENNDGSLQLVEVSNLCIYISRIHAAKKLPTGSDVQIRNEAEIEEERCRRKISSFMVGNSGLAAYPVEKADEVFFTAARKPSVRFGQFSPRDTNAKWLESSWGFFLRRKYSDFRIHANPLRAVAEGALISYTRDIANKSNTYQIKGNVSYPVYFKRNETFANRNTAYLDEAVIVPSVSFDYLKSTAKPVGNVDSLSFRLGSEWRIKNALFSTQYFWISPIFTIDSKAKTKIFSGEAEWRPVARNLGIGQALPRKLNSFFYFRWQPKLHLEWGYVANSGGNVNIRHKKQFARIGPKVSADLWAGDRTKFYANWEYLKKLTGSSRSQHLFNAGAEFTVLQNNPNFLFIVDYNFGKTPLVLQKTETLTLGIGVKF